MIFSCDYRFLQIFRNEPGEPTKLTQAVYILNVNLTLCIASIYIASACSTNAYILIFFPFLILPIHLWCAAILQIGSFDWAILQSIKEKAEWPKRCLFSLTYEFIYFKLCYFISNFNNKLSISVFWFILFSNM